MLAGAHRDHGFLQPVDALQKPLFLGLQRDDLYLEIRHLPGQLSCFDRPQRRDAARPRRLLRLQGCLEPILDILHFGTYREDERMLGGVLLLQPRHLALELGEALAQSLRLGIHRGLSP